MVERDYKSVIKVLGVQLRSLEGVGENPMGAKFSAAKV